MQRTDGGEPTVASVLAATIARHGCTKLFTLMGDGNMHLLAALPAHGVDVVEVRHEGAAVAMAEGYGWASDGVGFCSVTHGPGLTQTATSLVAAARNHSPLVLIVAETGAGYQGAQRYDQELFSRACEAPYRRLEPGEDAAAVLDAVTGLARDTARPALLGVPADLFTAQAPKNLVPAGGSSIPLAGAKPPARPAGDDNRSAAAAVVRALHESRRPVLIAGRGALAGAAPAALIRLADQFGAALATTVPAKGLFDGHPYNLGISGGLAHAAAEEVLHEADLVVAAGSSLDRGTTSSGRLFPGARIVQVTHDRPAGAAPDTVTRLFADAGQALRLAADDLRPDRRDPWFGRLPPSARAWEQDLIDFDPPATPGTVDPRRALAAISGLLPADALVVIGNGHCSGFAATFVQVPPSGRFFAAHGFGSIGQALPTAVGAALGAPGRKVVVFEGDAAFMMHPQEVETAARAGADLTAVVLNDQALGTEYQRLAAEGPDAAMAAVATPDLAVLGAALGARGWTVRSEDAVAGIAKDALEPGLAVIDLRTDRAVLSRHMRWIRSGHAASVPE